MSSENGVVRLATTDDVALITLDAPPLNILTASMMNQAADELERVQKARSLKAAAFTANGKAFSAGADVGEHRPEQVRDMIGAFGRMFRLLGSHELDLILDGLEQLPRSG